MAKANDIMAKANNRMMLAAEATLDHMVEEREVMLNEPSRRAAERLQHALADVERSPFGGGDEEELQAQLREAYSEWAVAHVRDSEAIRDDCLRIDLQRFTVLFGVVARERDTMHMILEEHGRRLAPPAYRLRWLIRTLAGGLGEHRRGEPATIPLPATEHAWTFWELPPGLDESVWQTKMVDPAYDTTQDIETHEHRKRQPRKRVARAAEDEEGWPSSS